MKTIKPLLGAGMAIAIVVGVVIARRQPAQQMIPEAKSGAARPQTNQTAETSAATESSPPENIAPPSETPPPPKSKTKPQTTSAQTGNQQPAAETTDPLARAALSFVGADPDADSYWIGAINDPSLSADERQNLIEDLNEDGLSDPRNPGVQDLPLIFNRLQLIEELAPYAMDQVNWDAFLEAHKDLVNMLNGRPVQ